MTTTTTDVRIWSVRTYHGVKEESYNLRWRVASRIFCKTYKLKSAAVKHRAEMSEAARRGVPFDIYSGLPITEIAQQIAETTWYDHAVAFADMKWPTLQPGSRRCLATALASVTLAMTSQQRRRPDPDICIKALLNWSFNRTARTAGDPPAKYAEAIAWVRTHSLMVGALNNPQTLRSAFDATLMAPDGKIYAAITHRNRLKVLSGAIRYAIELGLLERNPLERISTRLPRTTKVVDRRVVVNPEQARKLIAAVNDIAGERGPRYVAYFATIYYAGLRPGEVLALRAQDCTLPDQGWGELCFGESAPYVGGAWTDDGSSGPRKSLKHRTANESRTVPVHPELVAHLRNHIEQFGTAADGRLFASARGQDVKYSSFSEIWSRARKAVLTEAQFNSPLGKRPYDLRHACVSTWLNAGVSAPQIAEWAGHSVQVLLSTYAKCIDGQDDTERRRIEEALRPQQPKPEHNTTTCPAHVLSRARFWDHRRVNKTPTTSRTNA